MDNRFYKMNPIKSFFKDLTERYTSRAFMSVIIAVLMFHLHPKEFDGSNLVAVLISYIGFNVADTFVKINKSKGGKQ